MHSVMTLLWLTLFACSSGGPAVDRPVAGAALGPGAERPVWMFQYVNERWTRSSEPIAHRASSLGLGQSGDALVLTMQCFWGDCGDEALRHSIGPPVHAITTTDLRAWQPAMWRLVDPDDRVPIDTEIRGDRVWYYGTKAGMRGDPAKHRAAHTLYTATVRGERMVEPRAIFQSPGAADPAPLLVGNDSLLFMTTQPGREIGLASGTPFALKRTWPNVSVPHAMVVGDDIWLWAQTVRDGRMVPVRAISRDGGGQWSDWDAPLPLDGTQGCGNPVGIVFNGVPIVFCVTEPLMTKPR